MTVPPSSPDTIVGDLQGGSQGGHRTEIGKMALRLNAVRRAQTNDCHTVPQTPRPEMHGLSYRKELLPQPHALNLTLVGGSRPCRLACAGQSHCPTNAAGATACDVALLGATCCSQAVPGPTDARHRQISAPGPVGSLGSS